MVSYAILIIKFLIALAAGFLAGHGAIYVFNKMPASWLCDYGQEPSEELQDSSRQRVKGYPWKLVLSGLFTVLNVNMLLSGWQTDINVDSLAEWWQLSGAAAVENIQFVFAAMVFCWALIIIALADKKYGIIPDQFVILTAVSAIGFIPYHSSVWEPIGGLAVGAGIMLAAAFVGKLIFKQESLGFGDVKLYAAIGLSLGIGGTFAVLVIASVASAIAFSIMLLRGKIKRTDSMPLGPYICGAAIFYVAIICPLL